MAWGMIRFSPTFFAGNLKVPWGLTGAGLALSGLLHLGEND
jgi:hypothetical protein